MGRKFVDVDAYDMQNKVVPQIEKECAKDKREFVIFTPKGELLEDKNNTKNETKRELPKMKRNP